MPVSRIATACVLLCLLSACATPAQAPQQAGRTAHSDEAFLNRVTWGTDQPDDERFRRLGRSAYLQQQLHPGPAVLPPAVAAQVASFRISQTPLMTLAQEMEAQRKAADALSDDDQKKAAQQAYQQALQALAREAASRSLERDLYSPNQVQEQMTWFWLNHFNVNQNKANLRVMIGDYEDHALRDHALGHFHDLLRATVLHPAMIRYLDNEQNAVNHINENYARELMELHTLGVNGGYSQHDVQELARILTGLGVNINPKPFTGKGPAPQNFGLVEFNPARHDFGDKVFLGHTIKGRGFAEIDEALDILSKEPATAQFISRKLALYFVSDQPSKAVTDKMSREFLASNGDIAAVLQVMFESPDFEASLNAKFKDPMHFVVSSVRLAYGDKAILNAQPMLGWLNRMGEPWASHDTPDGYPLVASAWDSPGQMTTRFEIAKAIGSGPAGLFKTDGDKPLEQPAFPQLASALFYRSVEPELKTTTREGLAQATSPQEWNTFLLASPELSLR
jgi:uncharacterized protein (DUF1800 family)